MLLSDCHYDTACCSPMPDKDICVCFSGHRPDSLPWGYDEKDLRCAKIKASLEEQIRFFYSKGKRCFISGMAEGIDTYAAEIVLRLAGELEGLQLICVFPYPQLGRVRQQCIAECASRMIVLFPEYSAGCMNARNRFLVNSSSAIIAVYTGNAKSGTGSTLRMAVENGLSSSVIGV